MGARVHLAGSMLNGSHVLLRQLRALHAPSRCHPRHAFRFDYNDQARLLPLLPLSLPLS